MAVGTEFNGQPNSATSGGSWGAPYNQLTPQALQAAQTNWVATYPPWTVRVPASKRFILTNQVGGFKLPRQSIIGADNPDITQLFLWIRRRGQQLQSALPSDPGVVNWGQVSQMYYGISVDYYARFTAAPWVNYGPPAVLSSADPLYNGPAPWTNQPGELFQWSLFYPCWEIEQNTGELVFLLDNNFFQGTYGRYEAALVYGSVWSGSLEIDYRPYTPVRAFAPNLIPYTVQALPANPFLGGTTMLDAWIGFIATLTGTLELGITSLQLTAAQTAFMSTTPLGFGVELVLTDGMRSETLLFQGAQNGAIVVQRDVLQTGQYRFAAGSTLSFAWTKYNVSLAAPTFVRLGV